MHSHHSHSGQFCSHAQNTLEQVIQTAISKQMSTFVLTEHMPRDQDCDVYPEESVAGLNSEKLFQIFDQYYYEARRLQEAYQDRINILVGMEIDWIRPSSKTLIERLLAQYKLDTFIGSVHHVHEVPIDFDRPTFDRAQEISVEKHPSIEASGEELLFVDYYDAQFEMLQALEPPIVGHFDLIRLKSSNPDVSPRVYPRVWEKILRNLAFIADYGGALELNSAGLRKGMVEQYPSRDICIVHANRQGDFVLSDDSHGVDQVGIMYPDMMLQIEQLPIHRLKFLQRGQTTRDTRFPGIDLVGIDILEARGHPIWQMSGS